AGFNPSRADARGGGVIRILAGGPLPAERAAQVADGWKGDRLVAFARGEEQVVLWMTAWRTTADAIEFAEALPGISPGAHVERRGTRVLALSGPWLRELPAQVWASRQTEAAR